MQAPPQSQLIVLHCDAADAYAFQMARTILRGDDVAHSTQAVLTMATEDPAKMAHSKMALFQRPCCTRVITLPTHHQHASVESML